MHALAQQAQARGHHPTYPASGRSPYREDFRALLKAGQLHIRIGEHARQLRIREESAPGGDRNIWSPSHDRLPRWQQTRNTRFRPTGRLRITIDEGYARDQRPAEFRDTKTRPLEVRLPAILRELEVRALEDQARDREHQRQAQVRRQAWERAMQAARHEHRETHRAKTLLRELDAWRTARDLDHYLADLEAAVTTLTDPAAREAGTAWLTWATAYRDALNPLNHPITMPPDPKPTPQDLAPYLHGHTPYPPD